MWPFAADACQHWMSGRIWSLSEQIKNVFDLSEFLLGTNGPFLSSTTTCQDTQHEVCWGSDAHIVFSVCLREVYLSASFLFFFFLAWCIKYFHAFWCFGILTRWRQRHVIIPLHREVSRLYVATVSRVAAQLEPPFAAARRRLLILIVDLQHLPKDPFPFCTEPGVHVHSDSCCSIWGTICDLDAHRHFLSAFSHDSGTRQQTRIVRPHRALTLLRW